MYTTVTIEDNWSHSCTVIFTSRIKSAIDMLDITEKLNTEQETEGVWDSFLNKLQDTMEPYKAQHNIQCEFFRGLNDVIFELRLHISTKGDYKHNIVSEQIAGTLISAIATHFGWMKGSWKNMLKLSGDKYSTKGFEDLDVFRD